MSEEDVMPVRPGVAIAAVTRVPPADPLVAAAHFLARFTFETDVADVHADLESGDPDFILVDTRSQDAWRQGHVPGAVHLPSDEIPARANELIPTGALVVTYCWGPGCNGATRGALAFAQLGYQVKEMLGGYEYWVREGFAVSDADGKRYNEADPLTTVTTGHRCGC